MPAWLASLLFSLGGKLSGVISSAFSGAFDLLKGGINNAMFFHEQGIATAREMGMSIREANAYTESLTRRTQDLARAYGLTKEQIAELQKTVSENTVRNLMLTDQDADRIAQINKLIGSRTAGAFTEAIVNKMGGQLASMEDAVTQTYARAAKSGLNAAKYSEKVAQNLSLANRFSFRNGVDGIAKMTALSEKLGYNLQSVMGAADKFMEFDEAITTSARLNMLGGAAGAFGSNPLTMMYEAQYDPERFNERLTDTLRGLATFNEKTGMAEMSGMAMNFAKEIAKALGIDANEAVSIAKNQATIARKTAIGNGLIDRIAGGDEMLRDFLINRSQIKDGQLVITDANGTQRNINEMASGSGRKWLEQEARYEGMSDKDIMRENAEKLTTINEQIKGHYDSLLGVIAEEMTPVFRKINEFFSSNDFKKGFDTVAEYVKIGAQAVGKVAKWAIDNPTLTIVSLAIGSVLTGWFRTYMAGKLFGSIGGATFRTAGTSRLGQMFTRGAGQLANVAKNIGAYGKYVVQNIKAAASSGNLGRNLLNIFNSSAKVSRNGQLYNAALKNANGGLLLGKNLRTAGDIAKIARGAKALTSIGASAGFGLAGEAVSLTSEYSAKAGIIGEDSYKKRRLDRAGAGLTGAGIGAAVGSIIPFIGTAIGAAVGGAAGYSIEYIKEYTKFHEETGGNFWDFIKKDAVQFAGEWWDVVKEVFKCVTNPLYGIAKVGELFQKGANMFTMMWDDFTAFCKDIRNWFRKAGDWWNGLWGIDTGAKPKPQQKAATGGIVGGNSRAGDKILMGLNSGELIMNDDQIQRLYGKVQAAKTVLTSIVAKPIGEKEYIYTTPNGASLGGNNNVKINDFTVNITGEIRLNAGNGITSIDTRSLLNDASFISSLKEMIKTSISMDMNGGRKMNDNASMRGLPANTSIWGR